MLGEFVPVDGLRQVVESETERDGRDAELVERRLVLYRRRLAAIETRFDTRVALPDSLCLFRPISAESLDRAVHAVVARSRRLRRPSLDAREFKASFVERLAVADAREAFARVAEFRDDALALAAS